METIRQKIAEAGIGGWRPFGFLMSAQRELEIMQTRPEPDQEDSPSVMIVKPIFGGEERMVKQITDEDGNPGIQFVPIPDELIEK